MFGTLAKLYPNLKTAPKFLRGKTTLNALSGSAISSYHNAISITHQNELARLYSPQLKAQLHGYSSLNMFDDIAKKCKSTNSLKAIQLIDFKTYLAGGILTKVDRASMKNSLEVRVPYLDHHLVERTLAASPSLNLSWGQTKRLLVNGFKHLLPSFVTKRNKMGFSSPIDEWLRQIPKESLQSKLSEGALAQTELFSLDGISILLDEHHERGHEHGMTIWSLLIFNAFLEKHFGTQKSENIVSP
jgi:asparagine synthase (glutamine-hydrolysing)